MGTQSTFRIGLVQMAAGDDLEANVGRAIEHVRSAASAGAQIICLQELFRSRYFCQVEDEARFDLAEPVPGPTTEAFAALAKELHVVIVAPIFERRAPGVYHNTAVVIDVDGALLGCYRKMHIPDDPQYQEKFYFTPGDLGYRVFDTSYAKVGVIICWDQWYPEAARLTALKGAEVIVAPSAIGWLPQEPEQEGATQLNAWRTVQRAHAITNGIFFAAVNRVGTEESVAGTELRFWGASFVADPRGDVIAEAPTDDEAVLVAACDRGAIEELRRGWPFLRDRRIDSYGDLTRRYIDASSEIQRNRER